MDVKQEFIEELRQHMRQLVRELDVVKGVYLDSGLTFGQCHILFEVSQNPKIGITELSERLLIDKSNASRTAKRLIQSGLMKASQSKHDSRQKHFRLTAQGKKVLAKVVSLSENQSRSALLNLLPEERQQVLDAMRLYANALGKTRMQSGFRILPIRKKDNKDVAKVIRAVLAEFGAVGDGYSYVDKEIDNMFESYQPAGSKYLVILDQDDNVTGCGGLGPLLGGASSVCELKKMFFLPELRGIGLGRRLLSMLLNEARRFGYRKCYLETLGHMDAANKLYQKQGFERLSKPMGTTGHSACDRWYVKNLVSQR